MRNLLRYWLIRRILKSAAVFEEELSSAYAALLKELESSPVGEQLHRLMEEEALHLKVIRRLVRGPVSAVGLDKLMAGTHFHTPEDVPALNPALRAAFAAQLKQLEDLEKDSYIFYSNLARSSKIPAVKKSFAFLADQERQHLLIVQRLMGTPDNPVPPNIP
jgi:rubrerythrin